MAAMGSIVRPIKTISVFVGIHIVLLLKKIIYFIFMGVLSVCLSEHQKRELDPI